MGGERSNLTRTPDQPGRVAIMILPLTTSQDVSCGDKAPTPPGALENCEPEIRDILEKARSGEGLSFEESLRLGTAEGSDLDALVAVANELRRETVGDVITYVVNRNINFTN